MVTVTVTVRVRVRVRVRAIALQPGLGLGLGFEPWTGESAANRNQMSTGSLQLFSCWSCVC